MISVVMPSYNHEGYIDRAIALYKSALQLDPKNKMAEVALKELEI